ncbi:MAG: tail fiber domain-containing protein [Planctomycetaceae bacterium]|nr:tail fiber domain-containing protein [Planctomycetaceae bacterium]
MGFVVDAIGGAVEFTKDISPGGKLDPFFGGQAGAAAKDAADLQASAAGRALSAQEAESARVRGDLSPFRDFGAQGIDTLSQAISDPSQRVLNNPFFTALAEQQEQRTLASAAARGKAGSGGTGDDLQRNLLLLGNQFAQQDVSNLQNQVNTGLNAAAQTGAFGQQGVSAAGGILGNMANAQAAGITGAANAQAAGAGNILTTGAGLFQMFSDIRLKENVRFSHKEDGVRMYNWDWKKSALSLVGSQKTSGPIAQELKKTHPELVITDPETGYYKVLI